MLGREFRQNCHATLLPKTHHCFYSNTWLYAFTMMHWMIASTAWLAASARTDLLWSGLLMIRFHFYSGETMAQ
jgi:hypothetical protein